MADDGRPLLRAADYLDAYDLRVPLTADVILVFDEGLVPRSPRRKGRTRHPFRALGHNGSGRSVVASSPGSPAAAVTLEVLAALGATRVVAVGTAAALAPLEPGAVVVVERAIRDGAALRYNSECDRGDPALTDALSLELAGPDELATTVSTDQPFRQTPQALARWRAAGAGVLEMECATMFQVADAVGISLAAALTISDRYDLDAWVPGDGPSVAAGLDRALRLADLAISTTGS